MPRKWHISVKPWPMLRTGCRYPMQILDIRSSKEGILVTLEHLSSEQAGRRHEFPLPMDIYPDNLTARFLKAAGLTITVGEKVCPSDAIGTAIGVVFGNCPEGQDPEPISFHAIKEPEHAEHAG